MCRVSVDSLGRQEDEAEQQLAEQLQQELLQEHLAAQQQEEGSRAGRGSHLITMGSQPAGGGTTGTSGTSSSGPLKRWLAASRTSSQLGASSARQSLDTDGLPFTAFGSFVPVLPTSAPGLGTPNHELAAQLHALQESLQRSRQGQQQASGHTTAQWQQDGYQPQGRRSLADQHRHSSTIHSSTTTMSAGTLQRRRRMRPVADHRASIESFVSSVLSGTTSVFVPPKPQASPYEHSVDAQPSFENRRLAPGSVVFAALNGVMLLCLLAAAVVDYLIKTGRVFSS